MSPYRSEDFVEIGALIRANNFDYVGAWGDFELDPGMLEIDQPHLRDRELTTVGHPADQHVLYPAVARLLRERGHTLASAHALLRWALTADIRLNKNQFFFVAALSKMYFVQQIKNIPMHCIIWECPIHMVRVHI